VVESNQKQKAHSCWVLVSVFLRKLSHNLTLALLVRECCANCGQLSSLW
jgi:hypothetical protein